MPYDPEKSAPVRDVVAAQNCSGYMISWSLHSVCTTASLMQRFLNQAGFCNGMKRQPASLLDEPSRDTAKDAFTHKFEAAIIVTRGVRVGQCLGVTNWDYTWQPQGSV